MLAVALRLRSAARPRQALRRAARGASDRESSKREASNREASNREPWSRQSWDPECSGGNLREAAMDPVWMAPTNHSLHVPEAVCVKVSRRRTELGKGRPTNGSRTALRSLAQDNIAA
jgi:hypothetical protein